MVRALLRVVLVDDALVPHVAALVVPTERHAMTAQRLRFIVRAVTGVNVFVAGVVSKTYIINIAYTGLLPKISYLFTTGGIVDG